MPADLHPKKDPKPIDIPPIAVAFALFMILFIMSLT